MNYMRHRESQALEVVFLAAKELPVMDRPEHWALYRWVEGANPRFRIIGEDSDTYMLRRLAMQTTDPRWPAMLERWRSSDGPRDRVHVREAFHNLVGN